MDETKVLKRKKKTDWSKNIFLIVILAVPISNFLVFWLITNFNSILMAFQYNEGKQVFWGFRNYVNIWNDITSDGAILSAFLNTMTFFLTNLLITLPVSLLLCYFIFKKISGYKFFRFVFYLPALLPATALVMMFRYIIHKGGLYGEFMELINQEAVSLLKSPNTAMTTILFYQIMFSFGGNIILLSGAMNHIDGSILEAAKIDGCDMVTEIFGIVIPLIWPTLSTLIVFAFVGMLGSSGPILLFFDDLAVTEGYRVNTLSFWIYKSVYYTGEYYYASSVGLVMTAIGLPISLGIRKLLGKTMEAVEM